MHIKFHNYEILNFTDYSLVASDKGISKINSQPMLEVLKEVKARQHNTITLAILNDIFIEKNLEPNEALEYLESILPLQIDAPALYFDDIVIIHDWDDKKNSINVLQEEVKNTISFLPINSPISTKMISSKSLIFVILENFNPSALRPFYFELTRRNKKSLISVGHYTPGGYLLSQPYLPDSGNPCFFCSHDRITHYENLNPSQKNWTKIVNFCTSLNIHVPLPKPSLLEKNLALGMIARRIKYFTEHQKSKRFQDNIFSATHLNFENGETQETVTPHWHMCECMRTPHVLYTA